MSNRLPVVGSDAAASPNSWGNILNNYLSYALVADTTPGTSTAQSGAISYVSIVTATTYTIGSNGGNTVGNETVLANAASNAITVTLTDATLYPGIVHTIKKSDSSGHVVSVASASNQTIDGTNATTTPITISVPYVSVSLASDGSNWNII